MAESKRQSMASRVAAPKGGGQAKDAVDGDAVFYKAVGSRIRVTCAPNNNVLEGTLFTACNLTHAIALNTNTKPAAPTPASHAGDYHIVPFAHIVNFEVLSLGSAGAFPNMSRVDLEALKAREEHAIRAMKRKDAQKGKGVTKEAQDIFDYFHRTLPTRWAETQIIVNDAVVIDAPYTLDNLRAAKGKEHQISHIRKVLESFYRKKGAAGPNRAPVVATPIAPRKGG